MRRMNYGVCVIRGGKYGGRCAYYDDDDGQNAIVFLHAPPHWPQTYVLVPRRYLKPATRKQKQRWWSPCAG